MGQLVKPVQLNLHHLITFFFVASQESFSSAADMLFLTEPAVSRQIGHLEEQINIKLLRVHKKRVHLTTEGEKVFQYAKEIYIQAKCAEKFLESYREMNLHIGVSTTFSSFIAGVAREFESLFPGVRLAISNGPSYQIIEDLLNIKYDIAITVGINYQNPKLRSIRVSDRERLVLVISPSNPICLKKQLKLADLRGYPLLLPQVGSATREVLSERFKAEGLKVTDSVLMEVDYLEGTKILAEAGIAIGLLPETEIEEKVTQGRLKILPITKDISVSVDCFVHNDITLSAIGVEFISLIKKAFKRRHQHSYSESMAPA
jgi:DNA-binding transcriptional LysR family regulator